MRDLERFMLLQVVDVRWREHLENMDYLREGIHLRGMAQKDPLVEYRNEGHVLFAELNRTIREEVVALLFHAQIEANEEPGNGNGRGTLPPQPNGSGGAGNLSYEHETTAGSGAMIAAGAGAASAVTTSGGEYVAPQPVVKSEQESIGRNDPCWCGSGKKYKRCHGQ
jgi:preprotein translocase subunit SecA